MKYKKGDKVRVRKDLVSGDMYGKYRWEGDHAGEVGTIRNFSIDSYNITFDDGSRDDRIFWTDEMLEPADWFDALEVGDLVEVGEGNTRKVLAKTGLLVALSYISNHNAWSFWYTREELEEGGFKPVTTQPKKKREVTMEEVIKQFGEEVVIKKED